MQKSTTRRQAIKNMALGVASVATLPAMTTKSCESKAASSVGFQHSVCRWCYGNIPLESLSEQVRPMGISSIELTTPAEWPTLKKYGLTCAVGTLPDASLTKGYNEPTLHEQLNKKYFDLVKAAAEHGIPNVIIFSGNRRGGLTEEMGIENCAKGVDSLAKFAEKNGVMVIMELLNSKVDHKDYQCDHTAWGAELVKKIGSPNFKLLYDIYHMQIMEGDVIATIQKNKEYIAHFHTGGVPGRNEIDETQELYYPAIMRAISGMGFKGYVAQEFIPKSKDPLASLRKGVEICSV